MKHHSITKNALFTAIFFAIAQPVLAVTDEEFRELQEQFNILAEQVETNSSQSANSDTTVGGYGELHYNNLSNDNGESTKEMDFHRFVLFFNHQFNDKTRFFSELELEHGTINDTNTGDPDDGSSPGSVAIEQAYVQFDLNDNTKINAGVLLVPVGFINETHEPPTFYGVERNVINKFIIPTTWREGGASLTGNYDTGFSYDFAVHTGLSNGTNIRAGRQKVAEADASNLASTARIKYTGIAGLELGGTLQYQDDMTQNSSDDIGSATMLEGHVRWNFSDVTLTALYTQWNIDVADTASATDKLKNVQNGGYLEASYKLTSKWGIFARQNQWDNGGIGDTSNTQTDFGFNFWPHEDVVIKADYQLQNNVAGNFDGFNLGVGYQF
ncbi:FIG01060344: hypothetical protein [hydrothermal vent metagenome]|uniref:Porin n=1 Tax=hydrothermal vent metagenome TaxID=652676 RepID=A0A3B0WLG5_9ZZZZ